MKRSLLILLILVGTITLALVYRSIYREIPQKAFAQTTTLPSDTDWFTLGGNYQRTSWVNSTTENQTEVRGNLNVEWYQPIEPYIPYKVQPIFADNTAFISTSKGLYAFDLGGTYASGSSRVKWVYPTELPLGHSPTVVTVNNILTAYVGGYDKKIHAINANTGQAISGYTPYEAEAGFETNPLVIDNPSTGSGPTVYAGNRDGKFYALNAVTGEKIWEFPTGGPILFSAAYSAKQNALFFASNDSYAYAVNAATGEQIWKSEKLPGAGFHSYWPVIYTEKLTQKDYVVFGGSNFYRSGDQNNRTGEASHLHSQASAYIFPDCDGRTSPPTCPWGRPAGPIATASATQNYWIPGTQLMDVNNIADYTEDYPQNRTAFIFDITNGQEYQFDSDGDGKMEYAPFTHSNVTSTGNRYPAMVGNDGILYMNTHYASAPWITRAIRVGWKFDDHFVSRIFSSNLGLAQDEPTAFAGGGNLIYFTLTGDREGGAFDITIPSSQQSWTRSWLYHDQGGNTIRNRVPDYQPMYNDGDSADYNDFSWAIYSGKNQSRNGVYSKHGTTQTPPIPYQGKVYMLRGNSLMSWVPRSTGYNPSPTPTPSPSSLPLADIVFVQRPPAITTVASLRQKLEVEIQKMLSAGHLRPGYKPGNHGDQYGIRGGYNQYAGFGELFDYFQNPSETVVTLIQTLPYLSPALQDQVKTYLQDNYSPGTAYDFTRIVHIGWSNGAAREAFDMPADLWNYRFANFGSRTIPICTTCGYWTTFPPYSFYAAWKYAEAFGNAQAILTAISSGSKLNDLNNPATDDYLIRFPNVLNQYIAGYLGYLELQRLAGVPENTSYRNTYNRLLDLRISNFDKDTPFWPNTGYGIGQSGNYFRPLSVARNFMFMTPELGDRLSSEASTSAKIREAVNEYEYVAPYWFVSKFDQTVGEGTLQHLYDYPALFQAKAYILKQPYEELVKYLDVPAFERGDLFYIQNLTAALEVSREGSTDINGDNTVDLNDVNLLFSNWNTPRDRRADVNGDNLVNGVDFGLVLRDWGES